jgi:hypothetical protein
VNRRVLGAAFVMLLALTLGAPARAAGLGDASPPAASPTPSAATADAGNPLGSVGGIVVILVLGGGFLWLRARAMRR